jgi:MFS family permease
MWQKIEATFPALSIQQFRTFFGAKAISDVGTWMQRVVQGYIVYEMTGSAAWVGIVDAMQTLPSLVFVFAGGVLMDRYDRNKILAITQLVQFAIGSFIGVLLVFDLLTVYMLAVLAFFFGIANAIDQPARTALPPLLVPRDMLRSATSLNSTVFNLARIVGPMLAGFTVAIGNPGFAYIANGLSFLPLYFALKYVTIPNDDGENAAPLTAIWESFRYAYSDTRLFGCLLQFGTFGVFGWCYATIMPVVAKDLLGLGPSGLGTLFTAVGVGAVMSGLWVASSYMHTSSTKRLLYGPMIFSAGLAAFALSETYTLSLVLLMIMGFGQILQNATLQTQIQLLAPEHMRGRISSIQAFLTQGTRALGSLGVGILVEYSSSSFALLLCAIIVAASALFTHSRYLVTTAVPSITR